MDFNSECNQAKLNLHPRVRVICPEWEIPPKIHQNKREFWLNQPHGNFAKGKS